MLLQLDFYSPLAKVRVGREKKPSLLVCMHACLCMCMCALSYFFTNLYVTFIYEDIFTKFAENVYGCKNMSVTNFVLILKNNMAAIADCLEIIHMFQNLKYCS